MFRVSWLFVALALLVSTACSSRPSTSTAQSTAGGSVTTPVAPVVQDTATSPGAPPTTSESVSAAPSAVPTTVSDTPVALAPTVDPQAAVPAAVQKTYDAALHGGNSAAYLETIDPSARESAGDAPPIDLQGNMVAQPLDWTKVQFTNLQYSVLAISGDWAAVQVKGTWSAPDLNDPWQVPFGSREVVHNVGGQWMTSTVQACRQATGTCRLPLNNRALPWLKLAIGGVTEDTRQPDEGFKWFTITLRLENTSTEMQKFVLPDFPRGGYSIEAGDIVDSNGVKSSMSINGDDRHTAWLIPAHAKLATTIHAKIPAKRSLKEIRLGLESRTREADNSQRIYPVTLPPQVTDTNPAMFADAQQMPQIAPTMNVTCPKPQLQVVFQSVSLGPSARDSSGNYTYTLRMTATNTGGETLTDWASFFEIVAYDNQGHAEVAQHNYRTAGLIPDEPQTVDIKLSSQFSKPYLFQFEPVGDGSCQFGIFYMQAH